MTFILEYQKPLNTASREPRSSSMRDAVVAFFPAVVPWELGAVRGGKMHFSSFSRNISPLDALSPVLCHLLPLLCLRCSSHHQRKYYLIFPLPEMNKSFFSQNEGLGGLRKCPPFPSLFMAFFLSLSRWIKWHLSFYKCAEGLNSPNKHKTQIVTTFVFSQRRRWAKIGNPSGVESKRESDEAERSSLEHYSSGL